VFVYLKSFLFISDLTGTLTRRYHYVKAILQQILFCISNYFFNFIFYFAIYLRCFNDEILRYNNANASLLTVVYSVSRYEDINDARTHNPSPLYESINSQLVSPVVTAHEPESDYLVPKQYRKEIPKFRESYTEGRVGETPTTKNAEVQTDDNAKTDLNAISKETVSDLALTDPNANIKFVKKRFASHSYANVLTDKLKEAGQMGYVIEDRMAMRDEDPDEGGHVTNRDNVEKKKEQDIRSHYVNEGRMVMRDEDRDEEGHVTDNDNVAEKEKDATRSHYMNLRF